MVTSKQVKTQVIERDGSRAKDFLLNQVLSDYAKKKKLFMEITKLCF